MADAWTTYGRGGRSRHGQTRNAPTQSNTYGENYGSGPYGLPVMRVQRDGRPGGYMINFGGSWMDMQEFMDPSFQSMFVEPWARKERGGEIAQFRGQNPGVPTGLLGGPAQYGGSPGAGRVGSRTTRGGYGGGGNIDPAMMEYLLGG